MKQKDIKVGGTYLAKVSGRVVPVRVDAVVDYACTGRLRFRCTSLVTKREVVVKAATRFRCPCNEDGSMLKKDIPDGTPGPKALSDLFKL